VDSFTALCTSSPKPRLDGVVKINIVCGRNFHRIGSFFPSYRRNSTILQTQDSDYLIDLY